MKIIKFIELNKLNEQISHFTAYIQNYIYPGIYNKIIGGIVNG